MMERMLLLLPLVLLTTPCLLVNADKHLWKKVYKPYGTEMCREICKASRLSFIYNKDDLSCRTRRNNSSSEGKLSVGDFLVEDSLGLKVSNRDLIRGNHGCDDYKTGKANLQLIFPEYGHLNYSMTLHTACKEGMLCLVMYILSQGMADINCRGKIGRTPVMTAARYGQTAVFNYLVGEGCELTAVDCNNNTVLHAASLGGNADIVMTLVVDMKCDIDQPGWRKLTPVMFASCFGYMDVFNLLLSKGCNTKSVDTDNDTLLHLACRGGRVNIVKHILELNIFGVESKGKDGRTPVIAAAQSGHIPVVDLLVSKNCNIIATDDEGDNMLHVASLAGKVDMVRYIVEHNMVDIEIRGYTGRTAVMGAAGNGHRDIVDLLFSKNCSMTTVDDENNTVLHIVCNSGQLHMVKYILKLGVINIDSKGFWGRTAVVMAARHGHSEIVKFLISQKCDLNVHNMYGCNILHEVCIAGKVNMVKYILELNIVGMNGRGEHGRTAAMLAADMGHSDVVRLLLSNNCDLDAVDYDGNNILHLACRAGDIDTVRAILTRSPVTLMKRNKQGASPRDVAEQEGQWKIVTLLKTVGY